MSKREKDNFNTLVSDILNNDKFQLLENELHHGITRYDHSLRVARATYKWTRALKLDYIEATRAALLHDFFVDKDLINTKEHLFFSHPIIAAQNADNVYKLSDKEKNIIESHMFPLCKVMPKSVEAWVVQIMDKGVAAYEMYRFKTCLLINVLVIFFFNMITLQK